MLFNNHIQVYLEESPTKFTNTYAKEETLELV